jgi:hypothetical protein
MQWLFADGIETARLMTPKELLCICVVISGPKGPAKAILESLSTCALAS